MELNIDGLSVRGQISTDKTGAKILSFFAKTEDGEVKAFDIVPKPSKRKHCPQQYNLVIYEPQLVDDPHIATAIELPIADNAEPVVQRPDGSLYCTKCRCIVSNTANHEMRKEGFFAHSHVCGIRAAGEVYEDN